MARLRVSAFADQVDLPTTNRRTWAAGWAASGAFAGAAAWWLGGVAAR